MREEKLLEYLKTRDGSPTQGEMKKAIGTKSNAILYQTLDRLEEAGYIRRDKGKWRGVQLVSGSKFQVSSSGKQTWNLEHEIWNSTQSQDEWLNIPLLGIVAAGHPIEAVLVPEQMSVPASMIRPGADYFALEVRGDSMIDENILDGDKIALRQANTANNGDIVAALVDGENATVKTFKRAGKKVQLIPANREFETLELDADRVTIQGVLVGLVRKYGN
ncbi:MAG: transcriptional repressor LexA [Acidobacteriota bacterium]|nr:transcriptional repressor LexA [Acidobacteriota bacterium]MDH3529056.1 transcriptional repressor LexA [Acidobacteriota bacterium]